MSGLRFTYRAASADGTVHSGTLRASDEATALKELSAHGLHPLRLRLAPSVFPERGVGRHEIAVMFRNVAILVQSGVPIERAIAVSEPLVSARLASILTEVRRLIREGATVTAALEAWPAVFSPAVVGMIRAGERGSSIAEACGAVADHVEASTEIHGRVRAALAYPALILLVGLSTIVVMGTVVVPRFAAVLTDLGGELPPATRALLWASSLLRDYGIIALFSLLVAGPVVIGSLRRPEARAHVDQFLLGLPLVGRLRLGFASARACHALGNMLQVGVPLLAALDAARDTSGDMEIARRLGQVRESVARGVPLAEAAASSGAFSQIAIQLVGVGEASGRLGPMVLRAGTVAGDEAERSLRTAVQLIEPLLVIVLGVLVASVAAALLQAVYSIRPPL